MKVNLIQLDGNTNYIRYRYDFGATEPTMSYAVYTPAAGVTGPTLTPISATITASAGTNGSITPAGSTVVSCASDQSYTITADAGYVIESVLIDGVQSLTTLNSTIFSYTFASVNSIHTITATFKLAPDLTALLYVLPGTTYGTTNISAVVKVIELNSATTSGTVTVYITKDPWVPFTFNSAATSVGGRAVSNGSWSFDGVTNPDFYVLTTTQVIGAGGSLSLGLDVVFNPGNTKGSMSLSTMVMGAGEVKTDNNSDADKLDYFSK
jgi:hypothetical protein